MLTNAARCPKPKRARGIGPHLLVDLPGRQCRPFHLDAGLPPEIVALRYSLRDFAS
jgi:hypothetical protein